MAEVINFFAYMPECQCVSAICQEENEEEWLKVRTRGIGGSDIGPICNVSPFTSARQLYLAKTGQYPEGLAKDRGSKERMHFGHKLEPIVADEYAERTGKKLAKLGATVCSKAHPWALANVDRLILDEFDVPYGVLECKTTSEYMNDEWNEGEILLTYLYQLHWYLFVTGLKFGAIACIVGGNKFYYYELFRDDSLINNVLLPSAHHFWFENVQKLVEPEMQATDTAFANEIYAYAIKGAEKTFDDQETDLTLAEIVELKAQGKEIERRIDAAQNKIKDKLKEAEVGITPNYIVKWTAQQQRRVDTDRLKTAFPEVYEATLKTIQFRRMTVKAVGNGF